MKKKINWLMFVCCSGMVALLGTPAQAAPNFTAPVSRITFDTPMGSTSTAGVPEGGVSTIFDLKITNSSTSTIPALTFAFPPHFYSVQNNCAPTSSWNGSLAPNAQCDIYIQFQSQGAGTMAGTLTITNSSGSVPVGLSGYGIAANPNVALPWATVNLAMPSQTSFTYIAAGNASAFQSALNSATCGETIALAQGSAYIGNFTVPDMNCTSGWLMITSYNPATMVKVNNNANFPAPGTRLNPATDANLMATIATPNVSPALRFANSAHNVRLMGVAITTSYRGAYVVYSLVVMGGAGVTTLAQLPNNIIFDRTYIYGRPYNSAAGATNTPINHGINGNTRAFALVDSYCTNIIDSGGDAQCLCAYNGAGPYLIQNNYLAAASENVMFGGADPTIPNLVPSDITIVGNYFTKNTAWEGNISPKGSETVIFTTGSSKITSKTSPDTLSVGSVVYFTTTGIMPVGLAANTYYHVVSVPTTTTFAISATAGGTPISAGSAGTGTFTLVTNGFIDVKNLLELKNSQRVLVSGNIFSTTWTAGQDEAIIIRSVNQSGGCPWCVVQDVTFENNLIEHAPMGVVVGPCDAESGWGCVPTNHILIQNNVFTDIDNTNWGAGGTGALFQIDSHYIGPAFITINHNTGTDNHAAIELGSSDNVVNFRLTCNIMDEGQYGIFGSGIGNTTKALQTYAPGYVYADNVLVGPSQSSYPITYFNTLAGVGFTSVTEANALCGTYTNPTAGKDPNLCGVYNSTLAGGFQLSTASPYYKGCAADGNDIGVVDWATFNAAVDKANAGSYPQ